MRSGFITFASTSLVLVALASIASADTVTFDFTEGGNADPGVGTGDRGSPVNLASLSVPITGGSLTGTIVSTGGGVHDNANGVGVAGNPSNNRLGSGETLAFSFSYTPAGAENVRVTIQELGFATAGGNQQLQAGDDVTVSGTAGGTFNGALTTLDISSDLLSSTTLGTTTGNGWRVASFSVDASLLFNDGAAHTVPGTDGSINAQSGGTAAIVADSGGGTPTSITLDVGGEIRQRTNNGGISATGVRVEDNSSFTYLGGRLQARDNGGAGDAIGVHLLDSASASIPGTENFLARDQGDGNAVGILLENNATLSLSGAIRVDDSGAGAARGVQAFNNSVADIMGDIDVVETGGGNARVVQANDSAIVNINSGFSYGLTEADGGNPRLFVANDDSQINILGGDLANQTGTNQRIDINNNALVTIIGSDFEIDDGGGYVPFPVDIGDPQFLSARPTFDLAGILADGTPFTDLAIDIGGNGQLQLVAFAVPEPATIVIWSLLGVALGGFGIFRARRKK